MPIAHGAVQPFNPTTSLNAAPDGFNVSLDRVARRTSAGLVSNADSALGAPVDGGLRRREPVRADRTHPTPATASRVDRSADAVHHLTLLGAAWLRRRSTMWVGPAEDLPRGIASVLPAEQR